MGRPPRQTRKNSCEGEGEGEGDGDENGNSDADLSAEESANSHNSREAGQDNNLSSQSTGEPLYILPTTGSSREEQDIVALDEYLRPQEDMSETWSDETLLVDKITPESDMPGDGYNYNITASAHSALLGGDDVAPSHSAAVAPSSQMTALDGRGIPRETNVADQSRNHDNPRVAPVSEASNQASPSQLAASREQSRVEVEQQTASNNDETPSILQLCELHIAIHHYELRINALCESGAARGQVNVARLDVGKLLSYTASLEAMLGGKLVASSPAPPAQPLLHLALSCYSRLQQAIPQVISLLKGVQKGSSLQLDYRDDPIATVRIGDFSVPMDPNLQLRLMIHLCEQSLRTVDERMVMHGTQGVRTSPL